MSVYIPLNTQRIRYNSAFYDLIKSRTSFHTRNGKGNVFGSLPHYLLDTSHEYQISTFYNYCEKCKKYSLYTVKSYGHIILEICDRCNYVKFDTKFYTRQTRTLQNALSDCIPQVYDIMHKHLQEVKRARTWLTHDRRIELELDHYTKVPEDVLLRVYNNRDL